MIETFIFLECFRGTIFFQTAAERTTIGCNIVLWAILLVFKQKLGGRFVSQFQGGRNVSNRWRKTTHEQIVANDSPLWKFQATLGRELFGATARFWISTSLNTPFLTNQSTIECRTCLHVSSDQKLGYLWYIGDYTI